MQGTALVANKSIDIVRDGVTALQMGEGPDLVVLHSLLTDRTAFDLVAPVLAKRYRLSLINLPGFHGSSVVPGKADAYLHFISRALRLCGVKTPATFLGNGFGGTLALAFAIEHPDCVCRLVICDAVAAFPESGKQPFRTMAGLVAKDGMGAIAEIAARRVFHDAYLARHPEAIEQRRQILLKIDPAAFQAACTLLTDLELEERLDGLGVPTHVICGSLDQATPPALARRIADGVRGASYVEIEGCGHCPPLERPQDFMAAFDRPDI